MSVHASNPHEARELAGFVHRWVPSADPDAPVLVLLHGTGGNEEDLLPLGRMIAPGARLLSPRGQVLEHGMPRFFRRLAEGVLDVPDLKRRAVALADFVAAAGERYGFDPARAVAVGFSNGANVAAGALLVRPNALGAAALIRAMVPFEPGPGEGVGLAGRRVLLLEGEDDPLVPPTQVERLVALFQTAGAEVELAWQPGGHGLGAGDVATLRRWIAEGPAARGPA